MQNPSIINNHPYLNRLALSVDDDSDNIDPYSIIKDFFCFGTLEEMKELFIKTCRVGLSEKYNWKQGCPGNLLYFYERLEKLVEACFLVFSNKKYRNRLPKKKRHALPKKILSTPVLPCSLSPAEISDPLSVIESFFEFHSIKRWKQDLYTWLEAGLSNFTVLDNMEAKNILPYHYHLLKLLDACWYISLLVKRKKTE